MITLQVGDVAEYHLAQQGRADVSESASADVPALLHMPKESPGQSVLTRSVCLGGKIHLHEESPAFPRQLFSSTGVTAVRGGMCQTPSGTQQRVTRPDYLNWETVTQLFLQSFEFQQNIFPLRFSTHVLYTWLCATEIFQDYEAQCKIVKLGVKERCLLDLKMCRLCVECREQACL